MTYIIKCDTYYLENWQKFCGIHVVSQDSFADLKSLTSLRGTICGYPQWNSTLVFAAAPEIDEQSFTSWPLRSAKLHVPLWFLQSMYAKKNNAGLYTPLSVHVLMPVTMGVVLMSFLG